MKELKWAEGTRPIVQVFQKYEFPENIEIDVVEWGIDMDYPAFDFKNHQFECNGLAQIMCGDYEYEVIGNIHDNPELLEVEE